MSDVKLYQDIQDGKNDHEGIMAHIGMVKKVASHLRKTTRIHGSR